MKFRCFVLPVPVPVPLPNSSLEGALGGLSRCRFTRNAASPGYPQGKGRGMGRAPERQSLVSQ